MMRGRALATTVEARMDTNMPTISPDSACRTFLLDVGATASGCVLAVVIFPQFLRWGPALPRTPAGAGSTEMCTGTVEKRWRSERSRIGQAAGELGEGLVDQVGQLRAAARGAPADH